MSAYFIREDGPFVGSVVSFDEGTEWLLGRDPSLSTVVIEDPMVSRKHARLFVENDLFYLENLSKVNPIQINGELFEEARVLEEGDEVQIGNTVFRFTYEEPSEESSPLEVEAEIPSPPEPSHKPDFMPFLMQEESRFLIKVVAGPNQGAEFGMNPGDSYVIGKDPHVADIIFQDLSVSREHARLSITSDNVITVEDLQSRNGTLLNGAKIDETKTVHSQDLLSMGTTSFLLLDREASEETIYSPTHIPSREEAALPISTEERLEDESSPTSWKETFIPTKHLILASIFSLLITGGLISLLALFRSQTVVVQTHDEKGEIQKALSSFKGVQFSYSPSTGMVFLTGHVLTNLEHNELLYLLNHIPFLTRIEDNVIVDEGVWESMNALLSKNPNWRTVMITSTEPGRFIIRGFLPTEEEASALQSYVNLRFPYLNLLDNQVVVEDTLQRQIQNILLEKGFANVTFQLTGGELILAGRVHEQEEKHFRSVLETIEDIPGIRQVRSFVIFTSISTARIDLTSQYQVTGNTRLGSVSLYVVINGRILSQGDTLDGMVITEINSKEIFLEKDGVKYKIDYNQS